MALSELKDQWLSELKEFILESEKRICDKVATKIQPIGHRVAALEELWNRPPFPFSHQPTCLDMEADSSSLDDNEIAPANFDWMKAGPIPPYSFDSIVTDDSRYSAWSIAAFAQSPAETPTPIKKTAQQEPLKIATQAERGRPLLSADSARGPSTVQQSTKSGTSGKVLEESTWKPTFLNTWQSAPSTFGEMFEPRTVGSCEDCLRPDCVAWVEGHALPVPVGTIKPGQRVLCHDNLACGMKYAEVSDVLIQSGSAEWVTVVLEDGTHLDMTANHPTQPLANDGHRSTVRAGDLRPRDDHIMVLRTMPVLVKEVIHHGAETDELDDEEVSIKDRCFLTLKQPERHALFVAPPIGMMSGMPGVSTMAVGSANAKPIEEKLRLHVRNTFFDIDDPDRRVGSPRSNSVPRNFNFVFKSEPPAKVPFCRQSRQVFGSSREDSNISMSSYCSSAFSERSAENGTGSPVIGTLNTHGSEEVISLSEISYIKKQNLRSIGGISHAQGTCTPCFFNNRHRHDGGEPCWKGMLCERCHEDHDRVVETKPKSGRMRQKMAKRRRQAQAAEECNSPPQCEYCF